MRINSIVILLFTLTSLDTAPVAGSAAYKQKLEARKRAYNLVLDAGIGLGAVLAGGTLVNVLSKSSSERPPADQSKKDPPADGTRHTNLGAKSASTREPADGSSVNFMDQGLAEKPGDSPSPHMDLRSA